MTKRMLTIITGQPLPNYIPVNEPSTQPQVLHCIHTPGKGGMDARLAALKEVIARTHPSIQIEGHRIASAYDPKAIHELGEEILSAHPADEWTLNATAGTKLMSSPLERLFHDSGRRVIYVDTEQGRILEISADWSLKELPFVQGVDVETYFELFGQRVRTDSPSNSTEEDLIKQLERLQFDDLASSVKWVSSGENTTLAEFDAVATARYRLYVFERKRLNDPRTNLTLSPQVQLRVKSEYSKAIQHDLEKLAYTRAVFGGPFGQVYWLFSGSFKVAEEYVQRFAQLGITVVRAEDVGNLVGVAQRLRLPPVRPTAPRSARRRSVRERAAPRTRGDDRS